MPALDAQFFTREKTMNETTSPLNTSGQLSGSHLSEVRINSSIDGEEFRESFKSEVSLWEGLGRRWRNLFSYRNVEDYFKPLIYTLTVNILCFLINLWQVYYIVPVGGWTNDNTLGVISLLSSVLAIINVVILLRTLFRPKPLLAALSWALIFGQLVLYICEIIVYYQPDPLYVAAGESVLAESVCTVALFFAQSLGGLVVYRYWEFLFYNYDGSLYSVSLRSSLISDGSASDREGREERGERGDKVERPERAERAEKAERAKRAEKGGGSRAEAKAGLTALTDA